MNGPVEGRPVVVVGSGTMGRGIAYVAAVNGMPTRLFDIDETQLTAAHADIRRTLDDAVTRSRIARETADRAEALLELASDLESACGGAGLIVEAVVERMDVKHEVLLAIEAGSPADAIIATNTSALSITEVISCLGDPRRALGMHFFNPVPKMKLCELIRGLQTSDEGMDAAEAVARRMGKTTVRIDDIPGFATSRINALIGNEAFRMLEEGVGSAEDIDTAVKLGLNHPMGPFEMVDLVGLDTRLEILSYLASTLGERYRPTNLHRKLVGAGRLGRKSGEGVYRYDEDDGRISAAAG